MVFIFELLIYLISLILLCLTFSKLRKFCWYICDIIYDKKYNIKKATIIPIKEATITNMQINNFVIEIPTIEPIVIY
mgnify:FL=1